MARAAKSRADVQVLAEIAAIGQLARNRLERALPDGLSQAGFALLVRLAHHGGDESPVELARAFQVTKGAITNTLQRLQAQGFIAITGSPDDGRRKRARITAAGLTAHDRGLKAARPAMDALRTRFTDAEFEAALPFLSDLREWLDENR